ncbi:hypothetical protein RHF54_15125 [Clostridioides difficile]|nr:hypothetical protein [Clostridioides difficile]
MNVFKDWNIKITLDIYEKDNIIDDVIDDSSRNYIKNLFEILSITSGIIYVRVSF